MCNMDTVPAAGCQGVEGITQAMAVESSRSWLGIWLTSSDHTSDHSFWPGLQWSFISHSPLLMASDSPQGPVTHSRFRPGPLALAHSRSCSLSVMVRVMWLLKKKKKTSHSSKNVSRSGPNKIHARANIDLASRPLRKKRPS